MIQQNLVYQQKQYVRLMNEHFVLIQKVIFNLLISIIKANGFLESAKNKTFKSLFNK